jgi:hypothetical protein
MANVRIQPSRALTVIPSNNADVPFVATNISGVSGGPVANFLVDATKNFQTLQVFPGDIVYNLSATPPLAATIAGAAVAGATDSVLLNADIFTAAGDDYIIYQSSPFNGGQNTGCVLYVGTSGDLIVTTAGGDIVTFFKVQSGSFLPVQVIKVWESYTFPSGAVTTSAADIIALW